MATGHALDELEKRIGYVFQNKALLKQALTHSSYANEQKIRKNGDYERLEFLGCAHCRQEYSRKGYVLMSEEQARAIIALLSREEKILLNEMLKDLAQKRQPSQSHPASET